MPVSLTKLPPDVREALAKAVLDARGPEWRAEQERKRQTDVERAAADTEWDTQMRKTFRSLVAGGYFMLVLLPFAAYEMIHHHQYQNAGNMFAPWFINLCALIMVKGLGRRNGWLKPKRQR